MTSIVELDNVFLIDDRPRLLRILDIVVAMVTCVMETCLTYMILPSIQQKILYFQVWIKGTLHFTVSMNMRGRRGRDRMVVGFTTTFAINAYHH